MRRRELKRRRASPRELASLRLDAFALYDQGLTQAEIADRLGIARRSVARYIADQKVRRPHFETDEVLTQRRELNRALGIQDEMPVWFIELYHRDSYEAALDRMTACQRRTFIGLYCAGFQIDELASRENVCASAIVRRLMRVREIFVAQGIPLAGVRIRGTRRRRVIYCSEAMAYAAGESF